MVSVILGGGNTDNKNPTRRLLMLGGAYIFAIFLTYLVAGLGLIYFFSSIPIVWAVIA